MFPTFISILDIQSWWEVPSIAHFCSLFRDSFNLLDFDIEDLEEALLTDGTEESSWLQELIVRLLSGCLPNNEISTFNYQMFLRRLFRQKCQEHDRYNPFNTDCDFTLLPLRTKVDILHALCDFRLDAEDVLDQLKNLEADSLRIEPLGRDKNNSAYWYFYGTRLYREDFQNKHNKKKAIWQVICFTEDDWFQLTKKFKSSSIKSERALYHTLNKNFLPELPRLFKEKERQARRRLLENQPRRTSNRIRKLECEVAEKEEIQKQLLEEGKQSQGEEQNTSKELENRRKESYERRSKLKIANEKHNQSNSEEESRHEMASKKRSKDVGPSKRKKAKTVEKRDESPPATPPVKPIVGRQTNNSLSALDGQIVIPQVTPPVTSNKKKLKTSQVFQQTDEDLQVGMHKILDSVKNHEDAWPFVEAVEEEYAPNYYSIIRRPMDLTRMEDKLDQGHYKTFDKFKSDFQLIVNNCRLYNGAENEYTLMVDTLVKVFEKATERYLDQISSSDEEIAVENLNSNNEDPEDTRTSKSSKKKKRSESPPKSNSKNRKPALAVQGKKRERPLSETSDMNLDEELEDLKPKKSKKSEKESKKDSKKSDKECKELKKNDKESKKTGKDSKKSIKQSKKIEKEVKSSLEKKADSSDKSEEIPSKKHTKPLKSKKESKLETKKDASKAKSDKDKKSKNRIIRKKKKPSPARTRSRSRTPKSQCSSPNPPRSVFSSPPPSSPDSITEKQQDLFDKIKEKSPVGSICSKKIAFPWETSCFDDDPPPPSSPDKKTEETALFPAFSFKPAKDKHNKLRETIEKLKAKSEINRRQTPTYDFEMDDHLKENKDKNKKTEDKPIKSKEKTSHPKTKKNNHHSEQDRDLSIGFPNSPPDSFSKKSSKKKEENQLTQLAMARATKQNYEALSLATEQTLKDINKWLDDTPKLGDFSSASNSPSYLPMDDFDLLGAPRPLDSKKVEKSLGSSNIGGMSPSVHPPKKDVNASLGNRETKKKANRDPSKFFGKRREVQRTIERLQPGKSKGNLITNVQSLAKADEPFPLGPLSKLKDTKNSLIVKTDTNAPKLSLGTVLDSFGKHKFAEDDSKKEPEQDNVDKEQSDVLPPKLEETKIEPQEVNKKEDVEDTSATSCDKAIKDEKEPKESKLTDDTNSGGPTPNLSAWFKAFGAPKAPAPQKKTDKSDAKEEDPQLSSGAKSERVPPGDPSPSLEGGQPVARQRRISTGSSMSERSSFSQDLDSPRVGMEERGVYPAPYPSPLNRSPSNGASPVMVSPRPDISPRSYPFNGGQMRVGFYQDTVASSKSSPEKSCSPRENAPNSPYYQQTGTEHVYAPNTNPGGYSASYSGTSPYYTHPPSYSSTNPTPPYNMDGSSNSYYDTSKIAEHYQAKPSQNYTSNSPASSQASPAPQPQLSPHSPHIHHAQTSPSVHSPNVQSPSMHSPSLHSPSMHSPSVHSPQLPSPGQSLHSPSMSVVSPGMQHSPMAMNSPLNAGGIEAQHGQPEEQPAGDLKEQSVVQQQTPIFPMKKRAFLDMDMSSHAYAVGGMQQEDLLASRNLNMQQQQQINQQQELQEQLYQKHLQLQKQHQEHMLQQQKNQQQQMLHEQHKQQLLQEQKNQQLLLEQKQQQQQQQQQFLQQQQQKNLHLQQQQQQQQQQAIDPYGKRLQQSEQALRTPSPASLNQQAQQTPRNLQQIANNPVSEAPPTIRNMTAYPPSTMAQGNVPYNSYPLNLPPSRSVPSPHQQKIDMTKFTNMGYSGPEVNISRALQQQYGRPELSYTRTTIQSVVSQASQLLNSQALSSSQPSASSASLLPEYQKNSSNQQQAHSSTYQSTTLSVDSVAERLAAQVQQESSSYKQDGRTGYNTAALDLEQAMGLSRNLSNMMDRFNNEQRMIAGLQPSSNPYYTDKGLAAPHMFNKQIFSQSNVPMSYSQQQQQALPQQQTQLYGRQMTELQPSHDVKSTTSAPVSAPERKQRKKKGGNKNTPTETSGQPALSSSSQSSAPSMSTSAAAQSTATSQQPHGFQSYAGLKTPAPPPPPQVTAAAGSLDPSAIALKSSSVPGSAFNFGSGALGMSSGLSEPYPNILEEFRGSSNYFMGGANAKPGQPAQSYHPPPFLNPAAHQGRGAAYPLGGPFMDTAGTQLYQHYLQAGVLNQGLLGAATAGSYPPGYHAALAMRQPYDSMTRPSWL